MALKFCGLKKDNKIAWQENTITIEYKSVSILFITIKNEDSFYNEHLCNLSSQKMALTWEDGLIWLNLPI